MLYGLNKTKGFGLTLLSRLVSFT
ncbi:hypothetical protein BCEN4_740123 [Burkholderia cenocepacia]|nr:hypothetical protein BCEN4_740123 [Burkholderia cenocepacia]